MCGRVTVVYLLFFGCALGASAQTAPQRDPQAVLLLQKSLSILSGHAAIQDVTLTGTVSQSAGPSTDSGTATLMGTAAGQSRVELDLSSGPHVEVRDVSSNSWTGSWSGPDGAWHPIADHNLWSDPTWFFPTFLIGDVLFDAGYAVSPANAETLRGVAVEHISVYKAFSGSQQFPPLLQRLTRADIYLNQQTLLPFATVFDVHSDEDARTNIRTRIEFSNYESEQGSIVPLRIREFIQDGIFLDFALTSVQINTGLTTSSFQAN
jgi:hypothetical protein